MKPEVAINIVDRDKTGPGQRSAERKLSGFAAKSQGIARKSGLAVIGEQIERIAKLGRMDYSLEGLGRGLRGIGRAGGEVREGLAGATARAVGLGVAGETALGGIAEAAGLAVGAVAGLATVTGAAGVAAYMLGDKWAKTGGEIERTSQGLGVTTSQLQAARAANERFGVSADATSSSLDALQTTLFDAGTGANNLALGAMSQLGVKLRKDKDGVVDLNQAYLDLSDAIARQKNPATQKKLAAIFGLSGVLPAIRKGSGTLSAEGADYLSTTAALTPDQARAAAETERKAVILKQRLGGIEKAGGMEAMKATGALADAGKDKAEAAARLAQAAAQGIEHAIANPVEAVRELAHAGHQAADGMVHGGLEAGRHLEEGGEKAAAKMIAGFEGFIDHAKWDRNAYRAGFGSDTVTDAVTGKVSRVTPDTKVSRGAALIDLTRRVGSEFVPKVARAVGPQWATFDDETKAALTSVAYNYGHLPRNVLAAARSGDPSSIATAIRSHATDNGGINARRRNAEADDVAAAARAHVTVTFKNMPGGAVVRAAGAPGVDVDTNIARGMDGP